MNILYLCGSYGLDLDKMLGPKIHVQSILKGLQEQGHKAILLAVQQKNQLIDNEYKNIKHYIIKHKAARFYIHKIIPYTGFLNSFRVFIKILTLNKIYHFDVIHERYTSRSWGGIWASKILRIPLILEMNGPGIEEKQIQGVTTKASKKWVSNAHQKYILTNCDDLIIASKLIEIFVREKKGWKLPQNHVLLNGTIIPPPLKVNEIQIIRNQYQGKGNFLFIYSGSFYKWYGTLDMIKAISNVIEMKKNVRFILIGDGDAKNDILQYIKKKSLQQFIYVLPKMKHKDLMRYIQSVDFCLLYVRHKNSYAGSSTKLAEYMVCGKPVISTPQKKEMIDNGITGFLSESVDINDYTKAILFAMNNLEKAKQVAKNAKNKINKYYTWEKYCQNLIKIYNVSISTKKEKAWKKYFKIS